MHDSAYHNFDETRILLTNFETGFIGPKTIAYYYFEKNSIEGKVLNLFMNRNNRSYCDSPHNDVNYCSECSIFGNGAFLVFDDECDRREFEMYVVDNFDAFDSITVDRIKPIAHAKEHKWNVETPTSMLKLYEMLKRWKAR